MYLGHVVIEDFVHKHLEHCWHVSQASISRQYFQVFVVPPGGVEGRFPFIPLLDANKIVCTWEVKLVKIACFPESLQCWVVLVVVSTGISPNGIHAPG